jgi:hypothetical protein
MIPNIPNPRTFRNKFNKKRGRPVGMKKLCSWAPVADACNPSYSEIRRIMVQGQPGEIVLKTLSQKKSITKKGW